MATYTSQQPLAHSDTYVKATSYYNASFYPHFTTNPALSLTGAWGDLQWLSASGQPSNQRFHIDLGSAKLIRRLYYENALSAGDGTDGGVQNFTLWGSNDATAFATLTYATNTNWEQLVIASSVMIQHNITNTPDPRYILVDNIKNFRYYALKCANNYGRGDVMGIRKLALQIEDNFYPPILMPSISISNEIGVVI